MNRILVWGVLALALSLVSPRQAAAGLGLNLNTAATYLHDMDFGTNQTGLLLDGELVYRLKSDHGLKGVGEIGLFCDNTLAGFSTTLKDNIFYGFVMRAIIGNDKVGLSIGFKFDPVFFLIAAFDGIAGNSYYSSYPLLGLGMDIGVKIHWFRPTFGVRAFYGPYPIYFSSASMPLSSFQNLLALDAGVMISL